MSFFCTILLELCIFPTMGSIGHPVVNSISLASVLPVDFAEDLKSCQMYAIPGGCSLLWPYWTDCIGWMLNHLANSYSPVKMTRPGESPIDPVICLTHSTRCLAFLDSVCLDTTVWSLWILCFAWPKRALENFPSFDLIYIFWIKYLYFIDFIRDPVCCFHINIHQNNCLSAT